MQKINLDVLLQRQEESFKFYLEAKGKEVNLLPLIEKYSSEDKIEYTIDKIYEYIKGYVKSKRVTKEELEEYEACKYVLNTVLFNRGKEIIQILINSRNSWDSVLPLAKKFADEDGKLKPYERTYLNKCRTYYLSNTKNDQILLAYKKVKLLSERTSTKGYDVELINEILGYKDPVEAIKFVRMVGISRTSLLSLRNVYAALYPTEKENIEFVDKIISNTYRTKATSTPKPKYVPEKVVKTKVSKVELLKKCLEEYLISDLDRIDSLLINYNFTLYSFKETLKDAKSTKDLVLLNLINQYMSKEEVLNSKRKEILSSILNAKLNGVTYGNGFKNMNLYDMFVLLKGMSIEDAIYFNNRIMPKGEASRLRSVLEQVQGTRKYLTLEELVDSIGEMSRNGRSLTDIDKYKIASLMVQNKWPLYVELFFATAGRYLDNDITINIEDKNEYEIKESGTKPKK